jgi:hypothetical protein
MGYKSELKEGNMFGYSVLGTVEFRNGLVPDSERLPEIMKKNSTQKCKILWRVLGQRARELIWIITTLVGKPVKRFTLISFKTLEDLITGLDDLSDSDNTLSQTVGTHLQSVMLKAGYDEDLALEWVPIFNLYINRLLRLELEDKGGLPETMSAEIGGYHWRR